MSAFTVMFHNNYHTQTHIFKEGEEYTASYLPGDPNKFYVRHSDYKYSAVFRNLVRVVEDVGVIEPIASDDVYSYIADKSGVDRQIVKVFLFKFLSGEFSLPELSREYKLELFKISHIIYGWDEWVLYEKS